MQGDTKSCRSCNQAITVNFCSNCGQPALLKRVDSHYVFHELWHVLHIEKGIGYTIKEMLVRPGRSVRTFLQEDRSRLVKPVIFLIVTSLIYTLISHFFHTERAMPKMDHPTINAIFQWVQNHYGYANIMMGTVIALYVKLLFRKSGYNFYEVLILLCFIIGTGMLIGAILALLEGLTKIELSNVSTVITVLYCTWGIGQFFRSSFINYVKSFIAYILGTFTFSLLAIIFGVLIYQL